MIIIIKKTPTLPIGYDVEQIIANVPPHWNDGVSEDKGSRYNSNSLHMYFIYVQYIVSVLYPYTIYAYIQTYIHTCIYI